MTTDDTIARAIQTIGQSQAKLAAMTDQHRVNVRRLLAVLEETFAPVLERYLFSEDAMPPNSTHGAYLRVMEGMSMTSISVIPELRHPIPAMDFSSHTEDVIRWRFHPDTRVRRRFEFGDGVLTVHQCSSEDSYLMHEIGHMLSTPVERWWRYDEPTTISYTPNIAFNFGLKLPTTYRGVQQLCINEIKATAIEEVLIERYQMPKRNASTDSFLLTLLMFCKHRFASLLPSHGLSERWLREQIAAEVVTFEQIMARWHRTLDEIEHRAFVYRTTHNLPEPRRGP